MKEKPKLPANARRLNAGEKIQKGDLHWLSGEWREVVDTSGDRTVLQSQVGFYCRKL
jgi:hypothetical protein